MGAKTVSSANDIMNRVAAEIGVAPIADPFGSDDPTFIKMKHLINIAGEELVEAHAWERLLKSHQILTTGTDTGVYDLPEDFSHMVNQTGWELTQQIQLGGPMTSEAWAYLKSRNLTTATTYVTFRLAEGKFNVLPAPPPPNLDINFEYVSTHWVRSATQNPDLSYDEYDQITDGTQIPLFNRTLLSRYLKVKILSADGFDTGQAQDDFNQIFSVLTGSEKGAPVLNAGARGGFDYLNSNNVPTTGIGQ